MFNKIKNLQHENIHLREQLDRANDMLKQYRKEYELCQICEHARPIYQTTVFPYDTVYCCLLDAKERCEKFKAVERNQSIETAQRKSARF